MRLLISIYSINNRLFQSTHPLRDATFFLNHRTPRSSISIHAPLTGCDITVLFDKLKRLYFNPRTPYGMRRTLLLLSVSMFNISIHAPLTGCDMHTYNDLCKGDIISIHAPLTGCDFIQMLLKIDCGQFQSTHPLRDATSKRVDILFIPS